MFRIVRIVEPPFLCVWRSTMMEHFGSGATMYGGFAESRIAMSKGQRRGRTNGKKECRRTRARDAPCVWRLVRGCTRSAHGDLATELATPVASRHAISRPTGPSEAIASSFSFGCTVSRTCNAWSLEARATRPIRKRLRCHYTTSAPSRALSSAFRREGGFRLQHERDVF